MTDETIFEQETADETAEANAADESAALSLEDQLAAAQAEATDFQDRWLRSQAEFANARKRMEKQRVQSYQNATGDLAAKLLPIIDDFDRAVANVPADIAADGWFEGIQLVYRKMGTVLEGFSVQPIAAVGEPFDPNLHEAISQEPSDEYESGTVVRELQKGYMVGDRVIRPSLVSVAQ